MSSSLKPNSCAIVPKELAGTWIAWSSSGDAIIACGSSLTAVMTDAKQTGDPKPSYEKVRLANASREEINDVH